MVTTRGDYVFQYPGHEGKALVNQKADAPTVAVQSKPTPEQVKAKRLDALAKARAAKKAKLVTVAA